MEQLDAWKRVVSPYGVTLPDAEQEHTLLRIQAKSGSYHIGAPQKWWFWTAAPGGSDSWNRWAAYQVSRHQEDPIHRVVLGNPNHQAGYGPRSEETRLEQHICQTWSCNVRFGFGSSSPAANSSWVPATDEKPWPQDDELLNWQPSLTINHYQTWVTVPSFAMINWVANSH